MTVREDVFDVNGVSVLGRLLLLKPNAPASLIVYDYPTSCIRADTNIGHPTPSRMSQPALQRSSKTLAQYGFIRWHSAFIFACNVHNWKFIRHVENFALNLMLVWGILRGAGGCGGVSVLETHTATFLNSSYSFDILRNFCFLRFPDVGARLARVRGERRHGTVPLQNTCQFRSIFSEMTSSLIHLCLSIVLVNIDAGRALSLKEVILSTIVCCIYRIHRLV